AAAHANFVDFQGIGSRELTHTLWRLSGVEPKGDWVLKDDTVSKYDIVQFAREHNAYVVVGFIPAKTGKMFAEGMEVLVLGVDVSPWQRRRGNTSAIYRYGSESQEVSTSELCRCENALGFLAFGPSAEVLIGIWLERIRGRTLFPRRAQLEFVARCEIPGASR